MNYLLDTCVLFEFTRRQPEHKVLEWLEQIPEEKLYLSVITIGEVQHSIERLPSSQRKTELLLWLNNALIERFEGRILPLDTATMLVWGTLMAQMERAGRPTGSMGGLMVATALHHQLIIATRNTSDFLPCGVQVINPWE
jgi:tRNA(fMet)-specific endonuclease VapC